MEGNIPRPKYLIGPISANAKTNIDTQTSLFVFSQELPSGNTKDLLRRLYQYAKMYRHPLLARFLQESVSVLRHEVQKLPGEQRQFIAPFSDILSLGSQWDTIRNGPLAPALEGALVCIYELATFIGYYEAHDIQYNGGGNTCLAGISIGLFAAASVATSRSLTDLASHGAEGVRIAFGFCHYVGMVSQLLEDAHHTKENKGTAPLSTSTWASVVTGLPAEVVQSEIDCFNHGQHSGYEKAKTTVLTQVSISHVDHASVGVTGPPARLDELFRQSKVLGSSRHAALPISGGLCHVPNVYDNGDVQAIMTAASVQERWECRPVPLPLFSPHTGSAFAVSNGHRLIEAICTEALTKPLFFDKLAAGVAAHITLQLGLEKKASCQILHYRTSLSMINIISTIEESLPSYTEVQREDLVKWLTEDDSAGNQYTESHGHSQDSKLAVVGMACRMPGGADTPEKFWELLVEGRDTHTTVPPDRFDIEAHFDSSGDIENTVGTRFGNFVSNPGHFDAGFFEMSPREAQQTDPMQRLALVTAYEALEMAGFVLNRTASSHTSRVGTYYGQASDDYREVNASQRIGTYGIPGTERAFGNGRINYFFDFQGPSFNVDTACSSGLAAVHMACSALWAGDVDTAVAGGLNIITNPDIYCMLGKGHFLSQTGQCKVWDAEADGYCRGDGIGSIVIKRLSDALADNDEILATIVSGATNHSSKSISITQPHAGVQQDNYCQVMDKAGINPLDVSFVELHGTGTQVGDAVESESVLKFFAPLGQRRRPDQSLYLGAVKSNIGHGEAAAGIGSLIKVLLMYRHNIIPRHIGIRTTMNPIVERALENRNANVLYENTPWMPEPAARGSSKKRYAIVNSFGAHGGNTTLLLEDAPLSTPLKDEVEYEVRCEVVCISAKSKASLRGNLSALLHYINAHRETRLKDIAYTTSARRMHHHIRIATSVSSTTQLRDFLQGALQDLDTKAKYVSKAEGKAVAFAFSGQGCFYQGAVSALFERAPEFRDLIVRMDRIVRQLGFPSVLPAIVRSNSKLETPASSRSSSSAHDDKVYATVKSIQSDKYSSGPGQETWKSPVVAQLSLVVLQVALSQYWGHLGIKPDVHGL